MNLPFQRTRRFITEFSVERDMDYGEGGPTYQVHVAVTYAGCAAQGPSYASGGQPAEGPEWEIACVEGEVWNEDRKAYDWVDVRNMGLNREEVDSIEHWAEMLDVDDEVEEALRDEHEAALEWRAEQRRDPLE